MLGNGLVIAEIDEFCFFPGKPDSSQFRLNRLNNGSAETAVGQSLQPDNRHSGLPQWLCGNSISSRHDRKRNGAVNSDTFMVTVGVTSIPAAMGVHALVRRNVFFSGFIFGLCAEFLDGY
tara:strand:- start:74 stop:433 length:360 start_codon:yes stop_codon:yes gene_type:complete